MALITPPPSHWDDHPEYPVDDWKIEVENDETRLGYRDWVNGQIEMNNETEA